MRKIILGASMAVAFAAGRLPAQDTPSQSPAPIVPAQATVGNGFDGGLGAPIVPIGGGGLLETGGSSGVASAAMASGPGSAGRGYVEGSFLLMWTSDADLPGPLVTSGPSLGILGRIGTTQLSRNTIDYSSAPGFKVAVGQMLGDSRIGLEIAGFYLGEDTQSQRFGPTANQVLARPFFESGSRSENARIIASPGAFNGGVAVDGASSVWGFEVSPFLRAAGREAFTVDLLTGFRYMQHLEDLVISDTSTLLAGGTSSFDGTGLASGATVRVRDYYSTTNTFYGGQVGAKFGFGRGGLFLDITGKVGVGAVIQRVNIDGSTTASGGPFVTPATTAGGFLTADGRNGVSTSNKFAVLPEGNAQLGYQFTNWLNIFAGYSFTYLSNAARAAEQVNRTVNVNGIPTSPTYARPTTQLRQIVEGDLWFHGFNFGATITY